MYIYQHFYMQGISIKERYYRFEQKFKWATVIDLSYNDVKCGLEMLHEINWIGSGKMSSESFLM